MKDQSNTLDGRSKIVGVTARIIGAYVGSHSVPKGELPRLIEETFSTLDHAAVSRGSPEERLSPAIPVKQSIKHDTLICLECGEAFRSLKRHLRNNHGLTPDEYRLRWRLSPDYPMTSPDYSSKRSALAKKHGFGIATGRKKQSQGD